LSLVANRALIAVAGSASGAAAARILTMPTPPLYHSPVTGEFNCPEHAPHRKTDAWWRDRWRRVTLRDRAEWPDAELGELRCEVCRAIERRAAAPASAGTDPVTEG
jgi:hypothetical protein